MSKECLAYVMEKASVFFVSISGEECSPLLYGLEKELKQAMQKKAFDAACQGKCDGTEVALQTARIVKKAGIYPFYVTRLAAAAIYAEAQNNSHIAETIDMIGIRAAVSDVYEFCLEPELTFMIAQAYKQILQGTLFQVDCKKLVLMKQGYENGFFNEAAYTGCAQCTLKAFFDVIGLAGSEQNYLFKAASGLAGGVSCCTDSACGAYSASNLIIGTYVGRTLEKLGQKGNSAGKSHALGQVVHDKFIEVYGSINCCDLHLCKFGRNFDLRDKQQQEDMHNAGAHDEFCPTTVGIAAAWLFEALYDAELI